MGNVPEGQQISPYIDFVGRYVCSWLRWDVYQVVERMGRRNYFEFPDRRNRRIAVDECCPRKAIRVTEEVLRHYCPGAKLGDYIKYCPGHPAHTGGEDHPSYNCAADFFYLNTSDSNITQLTGHLELDKRLVQLYQNPEAPGPELKLIPGIIDCERQYVAVRALKADKPKSLTILGAAIRDEVNGWINRNHGYEAAYAWRRMSQADKHKGMNHHTHWHQDHYEWGG